MLLELGPRILFTKLKLLPHILLLSHFSLDNGHSLMNKEKFKNREFWLKTHNVAANYWGTGGKLNGQSFIGLILRFGIRPQHLLLYEKRLFIWLGDGI